MGFKINDEKSPFSLRDDRDKRKKSSKKQDFVTIVRPLSIFISSLNFSIRSIRSPLRIIFKSVHHQGWKYSIERLRIDIKNYFFARGDD